MPTALVLLNVNDPEVRAPAGPIVIAPLPDSKSAVPPTVSVSVA
ncbi:MAG: hypothetical protein U0872_13485 [Planctomycetaceae bacterium]